MVYKGKSMKIPKKRMTTGGTPMTQETSKYSRRRNARFYLLNVVLPVASIVFASISSLAVFEDMGGRLGATLTLLLTAVAYKYLVAEMVPRLRSSETICIS
jgi:hypothetical protein